jgi:hypothetical protein
LRYLKLSQGIKKIEFKIQMWRKVQSGYDRDGEEAPSPLVQI